MTESEYTLIRDLSSVINAKECLNHITPDNSPYISKKELVSVHRLLNKWRDRMFEMSSERVKEGE